MEQYFDFVVRQWMLFALLGVIIVLFIATEVMRKVRGASSVSVNEALQLYNQDDAVLLDVQEVNEFRNGHLAEAKNMPMSTLKDKIGDLKVPKNRPLVVYCHGGNRANGACNLLKKAGYDNVRSMRGGLLAWQNANLPVVKGRK